MLRQSLCELVVGLVRPQRHDTVLKCGGCERWLMRSLLTTSKTNNGFVQSKAGRSLRRRSFLQKQCAFAISSIVANRRQPCSAANETLPKRQHFSLKPTIEADGVVRFSEECRKIGSVLVHQRQPMYCGDVKRHQSRQFPPNTHSNNSPRGASPGTCRVPGARAARRISVTRISWLRTKSSL